MKVGAVAFKKHRCHQLPPEHVTDSTYSRSQEGRQEGRPQEEGCEEGRQEDHQEGCQEARQEGRRQEGQEVRCLTALTLRGHNFFVRRTKVQPPPGYESVISLSTLCLMFEH